MNFQSPAAATIRPYWRHCIGRSRRRIPLRWCRPNALTTHPVQHYATMRRFVEPTPRCELFFSSSNYPTTAGTQRNRQRYSAAFSTSQSPRRFSTTKDDTEDAIPACLAPYAGIPVTPDVIELEPGQRLVAVGDIHGDLEQLIVALQMADVIEPHQDTINGTDDNNQNSLKYSWSGGSTILVQIGDVVDRGPQELECWQLLADLARQAPDHGGAVVFLYGNHELWTSLGFYQLDKERYYENVNYDDGVQDAFEIAFGAYLDEQRDSKRQALSRQQEMLKLEPESNTTHGDNKWRDSFVLSDMVTNGLPLHPRKVAARWAAMEPGGLLAAHFLSRFKVAVQVGQTVLVHAGLVHQHLQLHNGISGLNQLVQDWIVKRDTNFPPYDSLGRLRRYIQSMPRFLMAEGKGEFSPIWMRDYSYPIGENPDNPGAEAMIDNVLQELDARRMVMGHTPQPRINAILDGKAWRIDVGMSRGMGGNAPEVLEVVKNEHDGEEEVRVITGKGRLAAKDRYIAKDDRCDREEKEDSQA